MSLAATASESARQTGHRASATAAAIQRAEVYARGGDFREAAQLFTQVLKSDAEQNGARSVSLSVRALVGLARVSIPQGAWLSAQTSLEQAQALCGADARRFSSELADVKSVKGVMLREQQRPELALTAFQEAVALREQKGAAEASALVDDWVNMGLTLSALHRSAEAVVMIEKALKQRPSAEDASHAQMALARVLWSMGAAEKSRATELFSVAINELTAQEQEAARGWARQSGLPVFEPLVPALPSSEGGANK
jgi:tetratricopeptide (TPR) repeat protein